MALALMGVVAMVRPDVVLLCSAFLPTFSEYFRTPPPEDTLPWYLWGLRQC